MARGTTLSSVEAYNTQTNKWSSAGQLTHAVHSAACVTYKNVIYMMGGMGVTDTEVAHVQMYSPAQHSCTLMPRAMPRAMALMRAVLWETSVILIDHLTCFIYNFESQTWQERAAFKTGIHDFSLILDKETLYIAGGDVHSRETMARVIWTCTDEVQSVSVRDVIEDKQERKKEKKEMGVRWGKHHVPHYRCLAAVCCYSNTPLTLT